MQIKAPIAHDEDFRLLFGWRASRRTEYTPLADSLAAEIERCLDERNVISFVAADRRA
jgi:hypothetical protein